MWDRQRRQKEQLRDSIVETVIGRDILQLARVKSPALYTLTLDADLDAESRGRAFEIAVGSELNRLPGSLFYWRERNDEVDFVYQFGKSLWAIEVKSGRKRTGRGLTAFQSKFPRAELIIVTPENFRQVIASIGR